MQVCIDLLSAHHSRREIAPGALLCSRSEPAPASTVEHTRRCKDRPPRSRGLAARLRRRRTTRGLASKRFGNRRDRQHRPREERTRRRRQGQLTSLRIRNTACHDGLRGSPNKLSRRLDATRAICAAAVLLLLLRRESCAFPGRGGGGAGPAPRLLPHVSAQRGSPGEPRHPPSGCRRRAVFGSSSNQPPAL